MTEMTNEERKEVREATTDALLAPIKARRVEILAELAELAAERESFAAQREARWKELGERTDALIREGREVGLHMTAMTAAAGWKSRTSAYGALGEKAPS